MHPRSGAGSIKHDGSTEDILYEHKDARKQYSLKGMELKELYVRAIRQGKEAQFIVYFSDIDMEAEIHIQPGSRTFNA